MEAKPSSMRPNIFAFFKRLMRFGYINCVITIDDFINRTDYELFNKICSASHSLYHLLPLYRTSDLRQRGHPFQLPDHCTDLHKNPSLFDPCINISNNVILVFSCIALCFYCFMCSLCSTPIVLLCILMCVCRILIKITYLLTKGGSRN